MKGETSRVWMWDGKDTNFSPPEVLAGIDATVHLHWSIWVVGISIEATTSMHMGWQNFLGTIDKLTLRSL